MVENIKKIRSSDMVLKIALVGNAILTFMFAYNYLPALFDVFGLMRSGPEGEANPNEMIARVIAGVFAVVFFDGAYYAWGSVRNREGVSSEQMVTADTAKQWALFGSLAASAGQFALSQLAVNLADEIVFIVSLVSMLAVAAIALMHMYWYDKFHGESFAAKERAKVAVDTAAASERDIARAVELQQLEEEQLAHEHQMKLDAMRAEMTLEQERLASKAAIKRQLLEQEIKHEKDVAKQTAELLEQHVGYSAAEIASQKAEHYRDQFLVSQGMDPALFRSDKLPRPRRRQRVAIPNGATAD